MTPLTILLLLAQTITQNPPGPDEKEIKNAVVKIHATHRAPSLYRPWTKEAPAEASGSGLVLPGRRILTNAHVVIHTSQIYVQGFQSADKLPASLVAIDPAIDLALLKLEDESFFNARKPLPMQEELPAIKGTVNAYGYPMGGTEMSVTEGVISRIEFAPYNYDTLGLRIQVDAALNPGNSGGPVLAGGAVVGIVISGIREADNIGYIIPIEEIRSFLEDAQDGTCTGKPMMFDEIQSLENPGLRARLELETATTGVLVTHPCRDQGDYPLRRWDVITRIGTEAIDNEGKVLVRDDLRLPFQYLIPKLARDGGIPLTIIRDKKTQEIRLPVSSARESLVKPLRERYPRYFIYGPLVFSPITTEFVRSLVVNPKWIFALTQRGSPIISGLRSVGTEPDQEWVAVVSPLFSHKIRKGYNEPLGAILLEVNGTPVRNLRHLVELLRDSSGTFVEFRFAERGMDLMVFRREEALAATEEILTDNGIRYQCSDDLRDVWQPPKK